MNAHRVVTTVTATRHPWPSRPTSEICRSVDIVASAGVMQRQLALDEMHYQRDQAARASTPSGLPHGDLFSDVEWRDTSVLIEGWYYDVTIEGVRHAMVRGPFPTRYAAELSREIWCGVAERTPNFGDLTVDEQNAAALAGRVS